MISDVFLPFQPTTNQGRGTGLESALGPPLALGTSCTDPFGLRLPFPGWWGWWGSFRYAETGKGLARSQNPKLQVLAFIETRVAARTASESD